jgi:hypothetical protein
MDSERAAKWVWAALPPHPDRASAIRPLPTGERLIASGARSENTSGRLRVFSARVASSITSPRRGEVGAEGAG